MTTSSVNGSENGARSGAQTLVLLAAPLNVAILRALSDGPKQQAELRQMAGSPAQTTLRAHLNELSGIGVIEKHRRNRFPGVLEYELTPSGRELLFVLGILELWLEDAPAGRLSLGGGPAKAAIKALAAGWSTTMLRALAAGPISLTKLDAVISSYNYPSLERRLGAMRLAGQIEAKQGGNSGRGTPYVVTDWLRRGVGPLAAATRWERRHTQSETAPIRRLDVETALLLAVPLLELPSEMSGACRIAMELPNGKGPSLAGVLVQVQAGEVTSCTARVQGHPEAWMTGSVAAWLAALIETDADQLELGGDGHLARALLDGLHAALFKSGEPSRT